MSMAIQYAMKKKARGGMVCSHGSSSCEMCHGGKAMAEGGEVKGDDEDEDVVDRAMKSRGSDEKSDEHESEDKPIEDIEDSGDKKGNSEESEIEEMIEDIVDRIIKKRGYSEGGQVANDDSIVAPLEENQFDDLVLRDDLEQHYTPENSGDLIGNQTLEDEMQDIVSRVMKSRSKRDRNPVPA